MTLVSVIIPVYNAELHLKKCIDSLIAQTHQNCEFIFVNDGSSDNSQISIEDFQKTDSRIVLINQQNQGVSAARNNGIAIAKGDYIGFVDADDTVIPSLFQTLLEIAQKNNVDVVISKYILHQNGNKTISPTLFPENQILNSEFIQHQIIPYMIKKENLNAIWTKLFTSEIIKKNAITFPIGIALGEDGLFNMNVFQKAKNIYFTDFAGYNYYEIEGSATRNFESKNYFERILQEYNYDYSAFSSSFLQTNAITKLKAEKCITKSIALLHEYTNPKNKLGFKKAYNKISTMLTNKDFQQVLLSNYDEIKSSKGKYEKFILFAMKNKWIYLLFSLTAYSRFRNKK
jgi:glycosyltransferase involved in cell wall biosynthesis